MGFNTTLIILNDALSEIKEDKDFGRKVHDAVLALCRGKQVDISSGCSVNAATAVDCHHADGTSLIAVGENCATVLSPYVGGYSHHTKEAQEKILKEWASQLGFRVSRKPTRSKTKQNVVVK